MNGSIRRVVVALDAVSENRAAIGAAARLAARWKAELHGVFVEDDDLIRLAHLPFARQVTLGVGVESLDPAAAERHLRAFAGRAREELAAAARRHGVVYSFETVRGTAAASEKFGKAAGDFLVAGMATRPIGRHFRVECRWWSMVEPPSGSVLLAHHDWAASGGVVALLRDRGPASERLLATAAHFAETHGGRLAVICPPSLAQAPGFKAWLDQRLDGHGLEVELHLAPVEPAALQRRIIELNCRLVALDARDRPADQLREIVAQLECDVLVVP